MKKIIILFVFISFALNTSNSYAQQHIDLLPGRLPMPTINSDSYPLLDGATVTWQSGSLKNINLRPYTDPGIALPPMNWDCNPGFLLMPTYKNCDPGMVYWEKSNAENQIPTFKSFTPPSLHPNSFITPFLLPGANPLQKLEELQDAGKLFMLDKGFNSNIIH